MNTGKAIGGSRSGAASNATPRCAPQSDGFESTAAQKFDKEFLIRLAATWLKCRWWIMGHRLYGGPHDLPGVMLGMEDNAAEMRLLCDEIKVRHV